MIDRCQLTGKASIPCVLIRYKGRGGSQFTLSSHYTPFLLRLWTIYRMDLLIKIHVRACLVRPSYTCGHRSPASCAL